MDTPISIKHLLSQNTAPNTQVTVNGWVRTRRDSKAGFSFIQLYDGSCFDSLQLVASERLSNYQDQILHLTCGCAIQVSGQLTASPAAGQALELQVEQLDVHGWVEAADSYPMAAKRHTLEHLRSYPHLRPRTNVIGALARIRHTVSQSVHNYLHQQGFLWVHTPIITANDCEGAGEMFRVSTLDALNPARTEAGTVDFSQDFFGQETFLTVSGQLNVESYCCALSRVYTFGPTFRAENSHTSRHLAEFWMIEPEMAFADLDTIAQVAQQLLQQICRDVLAQNPDDMAFFNQRIDPHCIARLEQLQSQDFAELSYSEAIDILQQAPVDFEFPIHWGIDLQSEHERYLAEQHCQRPVIVKHYPKEIKSFYMRLNDDQRTVAAMDVLAPGIGEIIGGSQREERLEVLDQRMQAHQLNPDDYQWYRDLRRYGSVPHAGFGLGLERCLSYITGLSNVRDVIPFPRTPNNASI